MRVLAGSALKSAKRAVRRRVRAARDSLPSEQRRVASERVIGRLLGLPELHEAGVVMTFWSFGSEVSTQPLIARLLDRDVQVALPRIVDGGLVPFDYRAGDPTTATTFGAREPVAEAERVPPSTIDVVVTPGLAFDRRGGRIGYGGGFYDRFLTDVAPRAFRVGVGFSLQLLGEELPSGPMDARVHAVVTDREVVRCVPADVTG